MLPDVDDALDFLHASVERPVPALAGVPARDLARSPAAAQIARLAEAEGLFLFHYEHRIALDLPEAWLAPGQEEHAEPPPWTGGVLPERKYQSFRHDQALGSMHPGHRGKWSTHELCHGLVGTAWAPDASPFFLATAGRLAELLPVALYYFFDEALLRRCPEHAGGGAHFRDFCPACEAAASVDRDAPGARERVAEGLRYLDGELAAIARSRRLGRPVAHRWATLDLSSDGVAYARAHGARLASPEFARWSSGFGRCQVDDLDALEARVLEVVGALFGGPAPTRPETPAQGRRWWVAEDIAWRLSTVRAETDGEAARELDGLIDALAAEVDAPDAVSQALQGYRRLDERWELLPPDELEAVGYALGAASADGLASGVLSGAPLSGRRGDLAAFTRHDLAHPERRPLPLRWADWLAPGAVKDLARYEAALATAGYELSLSGGAGEVRLARGARVEIFDHDVAALAERVEGGGPCQVSGDPVALAVVASPDGERVVVELPPSVAEALLALGEGARSPLDADDTRALQDLGLLVPVRWTERV